MRTDVQIITDPAELHRLIQQLIRPGIVTEVDHESFRARVQTGDLVTAWRPWLTTRARHDRTWWAPEEGEQVLLLSPGGDTAMAFILPGIPTEDNPPPAKDPDLRRTLMKDGHIEQYDRARHIQRFRMHRDGRFIVDFEGVPGVWFEINRFGMGFRGGFGFGDFPAIEPITDVPS